MKSIAKALAFMAAIIVALGATAFIADSDAADAVVVDDVSFVMNEETQYLVVKLTASGDLTYATVNMTAADGTVTPNLMMTSGVEIPQIAGWFIESDLDSTVSYTVDVTTNLGSAAAFQYEGTPVDPDTPVDPPVVPPVEDEPVEPIEPTETVKLTGILTSAFVGKVDQIVIVDDDLTVAPGATIEINGKLVIEAGVEVVFQYGSSIVFNDRSLAQIDGDVVIEANEDAAATVATGDEIFTFNGDEMVVNGTMTLEGADAFICAASSDVVINGLLFVDEEASATFNGAEISETGQLVVYGLVSGDIYNAGTVEISSEKAGMDLTVNIEPAGTVEIDNVIGTVRVTDAALQFEVKKNELKDVKNDNTITLTDVAGVIVTETIEVKKDKDGVKYGENTMFLAGNPIVADNETDTDVAAKAILIKGTAVVIDTDMNLEVPVEIDGTVKVTSVVDATEDGVYVKLVGAENDVTVTGTVTVQRGELTGSVVNAAKYTTEDNKYDVYTTLENALASGADKIELFGDIVITEDVTIEPGITVDASEADSVTIKDPATVTVKTSEEKVYGKFKTPTDGKVIVEGTLVAENLKKSGITEEKVFSDTEKKVEDSNTWTNVYNAIAGAKDGETVEVTKADGAVVLKKDLTIPAGVTLYVPAGKEVTVDNGVTVTVLGTLKEMGTYTIADEDKANKKAAGKTVVSEAGIVYSDDSSAYYAKIAGAYFELNRMDAISTVENAAAIAPTIESDCIDLRGDLTLGDIVFAVDEDMTVEEIHILGSLTAGDITLNGLILMSYDENGVPETAPTEVLDLTVVLANGNVVLDGVIGYVEFADIVDDSGDEPVTTSTVNGVQMTAEFDEVTGKYLAGAVSFTGKAYVTIDVDENVDVTVPAGAEVTLVGGDIADLSVAGSAVVESDVTIGTLAVTGTFASAEVAEGVTPAVAHVDKLLVGDVLDIVESTGADASASGIVLDDTGVAYVAPGSTVGKEITDLKSTVYMTESDVEYVTVYVGKSNALAIDDLDYEVESAVFTGWFVEDKEVTDEIVGQTGFEVVKATVKKDIYRVTIITDEGIKSVAIDNINLVSYGGNQYVTYYELVAGTHKVSFEYKDGYTGDVTMFFDKVAQSGYDFQLSGTEGINKDKIVDVTITLTGTVIDEDKIVVDVNGGKGDGMSLTEILLIVLVVLILIMAIIVAMRLMRS